MHTGQSRGEARVTRLVYYITKPLDILRTIKTQCLQEWKSNAAHDWYRAGGTSTESLGGQKYSQPMAGGEMRSTSDVIISGVSVLSLVCTCLISLSVVVNPSLVVSPGSLLMPNKVQFGL
ncbi:hypothetical protein LAZ67_1000780 [Cordylochernes scorpioides]|uniref:Uncharacterized protein n=1 Tax=Cordylochernes scorpioides TaxID=51811 RepID=A0ABY6JZH8_9ARAC|nr:hypothetical protein LAZ67_1000780 [Cordylochernes scorpioides]